MLHQNSDQLVVKTRAYCDPQRLRSNVESIFLFASVPKVRQWIAWAANMRFRKAQLSEGTALGKHTLFPRCLDMQFLDLPYLPPDPRSATQWNNPCSLDPDYSHTEISLKPTFPTQLLMFSRSVLCSRSFIFWIYLYQQITDSFRHWCCFLFISSSHLSPAAGTIFPSYLPSYVPRYALSSPESSD